MYEEICNTHIRALKVNGVIQSKQEGDTKNNSYLINNPGNDG